MTIMRPRVITSLLAIILATSAVVPASQKKPIFIFQTDEFWLNLSLAFVKTAAVTDVALHSYLTKASAGSAWPHEQSCRREASLSGTLRLVIE